MAIFIAAKARILVTVATAGAMFAGVAGLQAQAQETTALEDAAESAASATPSTIAAPTPTAAVKKKKKKPAPAVVVQTPVAPAKAAPAPAKKPAPKNHGSSGGSK